ncbi:MAG TPA: SprT family zinc-dependent metalloprotease [Bdellovibrionota bacterium]|nr:SprT family zinc-dependent metalloprotease [Bdellovibrionota bacterium]
MIESVEYGNSKIEFRIKRSSRKTLGISVLPCGSVEVTAPQNAPIEKIKELIVKRGSWLLEQQRLVGFNPVPQPTKTLVSGESFYFLGRHYRLKIFESNYDSVDILDDRLILNCTFPEDTQFKRSLLLKWYSKKAADILTERFRFHAQAFEQESVDVAIKKLSKRWGEFHPSKNVVVLNAELIVAPMECIDYVIIHELSHAVTLDHGPRFNALLTQRLPRWRDLKSELERHSNGFALFT